MENYKTLTETQENIMIGRTYFMWRNGSTNAEIAACLKRPIEEVNEWVEMCKEADDVKKTEADQIVRAINNKERVS